MPFPRLLALSAAAVALLASLFIAPPAANAEPDDASTAGAAETVADAELLIVLDSSSSMLEAASDGGTRADAAKNALLGVVDTLEEGQRVGLRQFGAEVVGLDDPASCTDSQLTVPVAADNRDALRAAANAYLPYGETPIGYALEQAGADLGTEGQRTILLISDGESNCDPDPCVVAADLAAQGIDLTIHVVGFDVSGAARDALVCIANAGGGQYFDVTDTSGLTAVFEQVSTRAFRNFAISGEPVEGTADAASAPVLSSGTQYLTHLPAEGDMVYYEVERTIPGSRIWITVTAASGDTMSMQGVLQPITDSNIGHCDMGSLDSTTWTGAWNVPTLILDSNTYEECTSSSLLLSLENWLDSAAYAGAPAEILVREDPPISNAAALPASTDQIGTWVTPPAATPHPIIGGLAFSDAPTIGSASYSFDLLPGETSFFRVPVDWGQSLEAQYTASRGLDITLFSPLRDSISANDVGVQDDLGDPGDDLRRDAVRTPPVTYNARDRISYWDDAMSQAGEWTVAVTAPQWTDANPETVIPVTLDVLVDGEVSGVPEYIDSGAVAGSTSSPTAEPTDTSTSPSAEPESASPSSERPTGASSDVDSGDGLPAGVPIALGVAGAGLLGAGAWMLNRRRTTGGVR